jgi:OOP family OmpA-OmpF porin
MDVRHSRSWVALASVVIAGLAWSAPAAADDHVRGVISARGEAATLTLVTDDTTVTVVLQDMTKVRRADGMRTVKESASSLIPGLRVKVDGTFDSATRFIADRITFTRQDMKTALAIQGGVDPTDRRSLDNQKRIAENAKVIEQQQQTLARQAGQIVSNRGQIAANHEKMVATTGTLANRIGDLADYKTISSLTVYFKNGQASVAPKYKEQLEQLAAQAKNGNGYVVQVEGYASNVGPDTLNQKLSMMRADAVTAILNQNGVAPPNVVVPAQMGVTNQVGDNKTAKGQAENRRAVVTLLQNKGISGQ